MASPCVCNGALLTCTFGVAPSTLIVPPLNRCLAGAMPIANLMDSKPLMNILPFGVCTTPSNPMVAAATAAALGVLTPMPCVPATAAPWIPGGAPTFMIGSAPVLTANGTLMCLWGGVIKVSVPGQFTTLGP